MESEDRKEVREMLTDILAGPLEKINGQLKLLVQQNSSIETQVLKTNGRVNDIEDWQGDIDIKLAKDLPHTIVNCPQLETITELKKDVGVLKTTPVVSGKIEERLRANLSLVFVGIGLIVTIIIGTLNLRKNNKTLSGQEVIKKEAHKSMQNQFNRVDSLLNTKN